MAVETFWSLTPRETWMMMEAQAWRAEQEQRGRAWLAWHTAALARMKRLPPLARLLGQPEARALSEDERVERRAEFEELKARLPARLRGDDG